MGPIAKVEGHAGGEVEILKAKSSRRSALHPQAGELQS
jgi:hypothetical protein